ncbi:MAG: hypothetical protein JTT11_00120 [Candidatus Brockarchaeota archaeon]|nr:hypothetical protein [Candidatus Brockarchaeota archaeon]
MAGARVKVVQLGQEYDLEPARGGACSTTEEGSAWLELVPGGSCGIEVEWMSQFSTKPVEVLRTSINVVGNTFETLRAPVHELKLRLVGPGGEPIPGAEVWMGAVEDGRKRRLGSTDELGSVRACQAPSGTYAVEAYWHGKDVSPGTLAVTASREYVLVAKGVGKLFVKALGALGQGLPGSSVEVWKGGEKLSSVVANDQGLSSLLLPYGEYFVRVEHGGLVAMRPVELESPYAAVQIPLGEFTSLFGVGLTPIAFAACCALSAALLLLLAVLFHEYAIWRRKRLPQLFR